MTAPDPIFERLGEIRRAFDASFAAKTETHEQEERRSVLAVRAGEGRFAVRVEVLAGVEACRKIVPIPESLPGLLGLAGIRGRLLAVYHLGTLLGQPSRAGGMPAALDAPRSGRGAPSVPMRWLLVSKVEPGVGFLIDGIEAFLRATEAELMPIEARTGDEHVREVLRQRSLLVGIVDLSAMARAVTQRAEASRDVRRHAK